MSISASGAEIAVVDLRDAGPHESLSLSEGFYTARSEIVIPPVPPHPTETSSQIINVLDTKPVPATSSTSLTVVPTAFARTGSRSSNSPTSTGLKSSLPANVSESPADSSPSQSDQGSAAAVVRRSYLGPRFGEDNAILYPANTKEPKDPTKKRKPKNNATKSSSNFFSRTIVPEQLSKRLQERPLNDIYAFLNNARALVWLDISSDSPKAEQMTKILFMKAHPLCHDFNATTRTSQHIDLMIGFSSTDLLWYEPVSQRYSRLNKNGLVNQTPISQLKWLPGSENLVMAAHYDGSLVVYDKEKDDAVFIPEDQDSTPQSETLGPAKGSRFEIKKSVHSKNQKANPVAVWKVANRQITGLEFSPDGRLLALTCEDGSLRLIDYIKERLLAVFSSFYGAFTCLCWSPDSMYILTGSQDDLVSIWSVEERSLVARCSGHRSWVTAVAFDPWRCDGKTYRFGSVADDCRLLLWDFSVDTLQRPRAASVRQSISSYAHSVQERSQSAATITAYDQVASPLKFHADEDAEDAIVHPVQPRANAPMLPPIMAKEVDVHELSWIGFEESCVMTACKSGHIRVWDRPREASTDMRSASTDFANPFR